MLPPMHRRPRRTAARATARSALGGLALVGLLAACGGAKGPSDAEVEKRIATELRTEGLTSTEATCFARVIVKTVGVEKVKDVRFDAAAPSDAMAKDLVEAAAAARTSCKIDGSTLDGS